MDFYWCPTIVELKERFFSAANTLDVMNQCNVH